MIHSRVRRALGALLLLPALLLGGCDEERESVTGPDTEILNGDGLFITALVSTAIYRFQNQVAETALQLIEEGQNVAYTEASCIGDGQMIGRPVGPMEWQFVFDDFGIDCETFFPLTANSDTCGTGGMFIRFEEVSPGLRYTMSMPMRTEILGEDSGGNQITRVVTDGVVYLLPVDLDNQILAFTTPGELVVDGDGRLIEDVLFPDSDCEFRYARAVNNFITCELEPVDGLRHGGFVHQLGTLRIEDRTQGLLLVEELEIEFTYDDQELNRFGAWPLGAYEVAAFAGTGFGGAISSTPTDVFFDGAGGATYEYNGLTCNVDFLTLENPCEGL